MKYLMTFSYDGSKFQGYQKQKNAITIQETIEKALTTINDAPVVISASGRTDRGVHALNQQAHFLFDKNIDLEKLRMAINSLIPKSIYIKSIKKVSEKFHARYDVKNKEYIYKINIGEYEPVSVDYIYQYNRNLDLNKMKEALKFIEGKHNFKSFTVNYGPGYNYNREIFKTQITCKKNIIEIKIIGDGFMRFMIRNIVGTIIEVGNLKRTPLEFKKILEICDRTEAGVTAPANGLYLSKVNY